MDSILQTAMDSMARPCMHHTRNILQRFRWFEDYQQSLLPEIAELSRKLNRVIMPCQEVQLRALGQISVSLSDRLIDAAARVGSQAAAADAAELGMAAAEAAGMLDGLSEIQAELLAEYFSPHRQQSAADVEVETDRDIGSNSSLADLQQQSGGVSSEPRPWVANLASTFESQADVVPKPASESEIAAASSSQASAAAEVTAAAEATAAATAGLEAAAADGPVQAVSVDLTPEQRSEAASWVAGVDQDYAEAYPQRADKAANDPDKAFAAKFDPDPNHVPVGCINPRLPDCITGGNMSLQVFCEQFGSQLGVCFVPHRVKDKKGQWKNRHYVDLTSYRKAKQQ